MLLEAKPIHPRLAGNSGRIVGLDFGLDNRFPVAGAGSNHPGCAWRSSLETSRLRG